MLILPNSARRQVIDDLKDVGEYLDAVVVKLYQNDYTPNPDTVLADFTEATFDGYAASTAIVWGATFTNSVNQAETVGDVKQFTATGATTPNLIYGYYLVSGATLKGGEKFDSPVPVNGVGDAVIVIPRFAFGQ